LGLWYLRYRCIMKSLFLWYQDFWPCDVYLKLWPLSGSHFPANYVVYRQLLFCFSRHGSPVLMLFLSIQEVVCLSSTQTSHKNSLPLVFGPVRFREDWSESHTSSTFIYLLFGTNWHLNMLVSIFEIRFDHMTSQMLITHTVRLWPVWSLHRGIVFLYTSRRDIITHCVIIILWVP
jgi:hypothetical protein